MTDSSSSGVSFHSKYYQRLDFEAKKRYDVMLATLGSLGDPYDATKKPTISQVEWQHWPSLEYPDIYNYFIATSSLFSKDKLRVYKSLEAYKYFVSGWVSNVTIYSSCTTW